jgi:hypothetical protein
MPMLNGISIELHCQQGPTYGGPIEEFAPRPTESTDPGDQFMPAIYDHATRTVSVFIPIFPMQQFWLIYSTQPPKPDNDTMLRAATGDSTDNPYNRHSSPSTANLFYVFKLFAGSDELATWSCGPEQEWHGKTVFGMFDTSTSTSGKGLQKRIMTFGSQGPQISGDLAAQSDVDRKIEVRVYRADRALRVPRQTDIWRGSDTSEIKYTVLNSSRKYTIFVC